MNEILRSVFTALIFISFDFWKFVAIISQFYWERLHRIFTLSFRE